MYFQQLHNDSLLLDMTVAGHNLSGYPWKKWIKAENYMIGVIA